MMVFQTRSQHQGRLNPDQIASQLAAIASRLDAIVSLLRDDVAAIKESWMDENESENEPQGPLTEPLKDTKTTPVPLTPVMLPWNEDVPSYFKDKNKSFDVGDVAEIKAWMGVKEVQSEKQADVEKEDSHGATQTHSSTTKLNSEHDADTCDTWRPRHSIEANSNVEGSVQAAPGLGLKKKQVDGTIGCDKSSGPIARPCARVPEKLVTVLLPRSLHACFLFSVGSRTRNMLFRSPRPMAFCPVRETGVNNNLQPYFNSAYEGVNKAGQTVIEWLIAWCYHSLQDAIRESYHYLMHQFPFDLRTSLFSGQDVLIQTHGSIQLGI